MRSVLFTLAQREIVGHADRCSIARQCKADPRPATMRFISRHAISSMHGEEACCRCRSTQGTQGDRGRFQSSMALHNRPVASPAPHISAYPTKARSSTSHRLRSMSPAHLLSGRSHDARSRYRAVVFTSRQRFRGMAGASRSSGPQVAISMSGPMNSGAILQPLTSEPA